MAQTTTSKSTLLNNAAKDDTITGTTFSINDLLGNDPGGANKAGGFFFGDVAGDQSQQAQYLLDHGLTKISDDNGGTYTTNGTDFKYFVQMGNNGTWSQATVDVKLPHAGATLLEENFDSYGEDVGQGPWAWTPVNLGDTGWQSTGSNTEVVSTGYANGLVDSSSGGWWLDTQATTGPIDIAKTFNDPAGGQVKISFDLGTQDLTSTGNGATAADASFTIMVDDAIVGTVTAAEIRAVKGDNTMMHFDFYADVGAAGQHEVRFVYTTPTESNFGFSLDTIKVVDWLI